MDISEHDPRCFVCVLYLFATYLNAQAGSEDDMQKMAEYAALYLANEWPMPTILSKYAARIMASIATGTPCKINKLLMVKPKQRGAKRTMMSRDAAIYYAINAITHPQFAKQTEAIRLVADAWEDVTGEDVDIQKVKRIYFATRKRLQEATSNAHQRKDEILAGNRSWIGSISSDYDCPIHHQRDLHHKCKQYLEEEETLGLMRITERLLPLPEQKKDESFEQYAQRIDLGDKLRAIHIDDVLSSLKDDLRQ